MNICHTIPDDKRQLHGITLPELLVSIAICSLLFGIIASAVQGARERARRMTCSSHLRQIGLAIHAYEGTYGVLPPEGNNDSVLVKILPFLGETPRYQQILAARNNRTLFILVQEQDQPPSVYSCPSELRPRTNTVAWAPYFFNGGSGVQKYGWNGYIGNVPTSAYVDGLSQTAFYSEFHLKINPQSDIRVPLSDVWQTERVMHDPNQLDDFATYCDTMTLTPSMASDIWGVSWYGESFDSNWYNHVLPPMHRSCCNGYEVLDNAENFAAYTAWSTHKGGVNTLFGDGNVRFISQDIDRLVWRAAGSRNGEERSSILRSF